MQEREMQRVGAGEGAWGRERGQGRAAMVGRVGVGG